MPAWSLTGLFFVTLAAPVTGDREPAAASTDGRVRVIDVAADATYRMPPGARLAGPVDIAQSRTRNDVVDAPRDRRFDRPLAGGVTVIADPQADSLKALLRDRMARRGGAIDARVEWRLTGRGSDVGLGGGLKRVVDTLLHD